MIKGVSDVFACDLRTRILHVGDARARFHPSVGTVTSFLAGVPLSTNVPASTPEVHGQTHIPHSTHIPLQSIPVWKRVQTLLTISTNNTGSVQ